MTLVSAGRVGRPHGHDGSFWVDDARHPLPAGVEVTVAGRTHAVERRAGTDSRPLVRLAGLGDPRAARGQALLVEEELEAGEWLASELTGCEVTGLGRVARVIDAPSCPLLELEDGRLVPLISDAIRSVDVERKRIEADPDFLG